MLKMPRVSVKSGHGGSRTHMRQSSCDFESHAYANSATRPLQNYSFSLKKHKNFKSERSRIYTYIQGSCL